MTGVPPVGPEQELLGALLLTPEPIPDVMDIISGPDFYNPVHEDVWNAIVLVWSTGDRPDPATVRLALGSKANRMDGGPAYLLTLTGACPVPLSAPIYARGVAEAAARRRLAQAGAQIAALADVDGSAADLVEAARKQLDRAESSLGAVSYHRLVDLLEAAVEPESHDRAVVLDTPWPHLNDLIGGVEPGQLVVLGARPGVGKTTAAVNLAAWSAGVKGIGAFVASLEMSRTELATNLLAAEARVPNQAIRRGLVGTGVYSADHLGRAVGSLSEWPLWIDDTPTQTMATIRSSVRSLQRHNTLRLVVVDYAQLMSAEPGVRVENRQQEVSVISRKAKLLAKELGVVVVLVSQLNRGSESGRAPREPVLSDLRESGSLEQDADMVWLLHVRDEARQDVELIVAKNRSGPLGDVGLTRQGAYGRLVANY